jgi:hypothetical protein
VLKSENYGQNWSWTVFPPALAGVTVIQTDSTSSETLHEYAIAGACVSTSTVSHSLLALRGPLTRGEMTSNGLFLSFQGRDQLV